MSYSYSRASRWIASLAFLGACLAATHASAMTITVTNASTSTSGSQTTSGGASQAIADLATGHLGAAIYGTAAPVPGAYAQVFFTLGFADTQPGDFITIELSLHGTFTPGSGGIVNFYTEPSSTGPITNQASISCNTYNQVNYGSDCYGGLYGQPGLVTNSLTFNLPVDDGTMDFNPLLQLAVGNAVFPVDVNFLSSADFSIIVPDATIVAENPFTDTPGTTLFRTVSGNVITTGGSAPSSVPEPATLALLGIGLAGLSFSRRRKPH